METIDLFPSRVYKFKIDPDSYNKEELVDTFMENYKRSPQRNQWDATSKLHHYYNDFDNKDFKNPDDGQLVQLYTNIVNKFVESLQLKTPLRYRWEISNYAVNTEHMVSHQHLHTQLIDSADQTDLLSCQYVGVHYIKFNKIKHRPTQFFNPLHRTTMSPFATEITNLYCVNIPNSEFFSSYELETEEDDFFIFPAGLKHSVDSCVDADDPRIISAVNILFEIHPFRKTI